MSQYTKADCVRVYYNKGHW